MCRSILIFVSHTGWKLWAASSLGLINIHYGEGRGATINNMWLNLAVTKSKLTENSSVLYIYEHYPHQHMLHCHTYTVELLKRQVALPPEAQPV